MATISEIVNSEYAREHFDNGKRYLLRGWTVYQLNHCANYNTDTHLVAQKIYKSDNYVPLVNRGRIMIVDGDFVNNLVGFELVNNY